MVSHSHPPHDSHDSHDAHDDSHHHSHGGVGKYVAVFVALLVLTFISFGVGNYAPLRENAPAAMWALMMAVSCLKAMLVILFFMHLLWEANWKYVLTIPASMMSLFLLLMLVPDIGRRTARYAEERWLHAAEPVQKQPEHPAGKAADHAEPAPHHAEDAKGKAH